MYNNFISKVISKPTQATLDAMFAVSGASGKTGYRIAEEALNALNIDNNGLDGMDKKLLEAIVHNFNGGPVGLDSLGVVISENSKTIEEVYEPYLIKEGFIQRTTRGRIALQKAYTYLNIKQEK